MAEDKLRINWDDLRSRRVDNRLREQGAMERNRAYSQMKEDALPQASAPAGSIWNNAIFCMTVFGLLGGLLAWGTELLIAGPLTPIIGATMHYDPDARADADKRLSQISQIEVKRDTGVLDKLQADTTVAEIKSDGLHNPWFALAVNGRLTDSQRKAKRLDLEASERFAVFVINLMSYGLCGMMLAMCLAISDPVMQQKRREAFINGGIGAGVGIVGGIAAALLLDRITALADSMISVKEAWSRATVQQAAAWGMLGLFLGLGSGIALRNSKKIGVGMAGGLLGGIIGGALFGPVQNLAHNASISRLVAFVAIGVVAGLASGWLENVVKSGWLKVTSGIIAGKQFILYRNPTYIGSAPDCQIYLFKDNQVGKRHAALHLLPTGIEIEDLPLGTSTKVNGTPVKRAKLKNGDTIEIGSTSFRFQEKRPARA